MRPSGSRSCRLLQIVFVASLLFSASSAKAEPESACIAAVPATVMLEDGRRIGGLGPGHFQARIADRKAEIRLTELDQTPKRILFLIDSSRRMSVHAWQITKEVALFILNNARPQDRFGLVTFGPQGNEKVTAGFVEERTNLKDQLGALGMEAQEKAAEHSRDYDALRGAREVFGSPQFGDAVFMFSGGPDEGSETSSSELREALLAGRIRLYVLALGDKSTTGTYWTGGGREVPYNSALYPLNEIARASGGLLFLEDTTRAWGAYELTTSRLEELKFQAMQVYSQIAEPYRIEMNNVVGRTPLVKWKLELERSVRNKIPNTLLLYPERIRPCPP